MSKVMALSRRSFIVSAAAGIGGLALGIPLRPAWGQSSRDVAPEINAWLVIQPNDTVIVRIARSEMGQGILTSLAQLVAEELDCDWAKVRTEYPTPGQNAARERIWGDFSTFGSLSIRQSHEPMCKGGAAARLMLIQAAANAWNVPASECSTASGVITHTPSGRTVSYGHVAVAAAAITPPTHIPLKEPRDWKIAGKGVRTLEAADKATGRMLYGLDIVRPGMLNAAVKACPVNGGKLRSFDAEAVAQMPGVRHVVPVGDTAVAVVADTWWHAKTAIDALPVEWDNGPGAGVSNDDITELLKEGLGAPEAFVGNQAGDAKAAIAGAARTIEAEYDYPYQNHACMEPLNATVLYTPERCDVWTGTQSGEGAWMAAVEASGLPPENVELHKLMMGGGFGRRSMADYVTQAVQIARQIPGTPIKMIWSREEDMLHGAYHPVTRARLTGAFDASGELVGLHMRISGQSILASTSPDWMAPDGSDPLVFDGLSAEGEAALNYNVPNLMVDHAMRNPHVMAGAWRGLNSNQNCLYSECFMDELAASARQDPLEFRLSLMGDRPKQRAVLEAAAEHVGWGRPAPEGIFRGLAQFMALNSHVAAVAEISVEDETRVRLHRIVVAVDPGHVVNPAQLERQVAGGLVFGLSALFLQECTVKDGRIEQENFDSYDSMRLAQMPKVETIIMPSGGFWGGGGEVSTFIGAPAVVNAYAAATGKRIRSFPLKKHGIAFA